jgi:1,4-dihydroxy-2-naphthoate octaprenyltransferase
MIIFDFDADQYGKPTSISGGSGVLLNYPELRRFSKCFAILLMSLSIVVAILFTILFFIPISFIVFVVLGNS